MKKTLGIIGGMGPLATADLFRKIVEHTEAACDQEHIHVLIDNNTNIPDRTKALLDGGADPTEELQKSAKRLIAAGAEALMMPCNTAHNFHEAVKAVSEVPVLHMIDLTRDSLKEQGVTCAGLLATTGTFRTGIYQSRFASQIELLTPNEEEQEAVMDMIYGGVKAGVRDYDASKVQACAQRLIAAGAQTIILGCTELPLAMDLYDLDFPSCDPTLELALGAIRFAGGTVKE